MKTQNIAAEGKIVSCLANCRFGVELDNGHIVLCRVCGKLIKYYIRLTLGDHVAIEIGAYDLTRGRIVKRF